MTSPAKHYSGRLPISDGVLTLGGLTGFSSLFCVSSVHRLGELSIERVNALRRPSDLFGVVTPSSSMGRLDLSCPGRRGINRCLGDLGRLTPSGCTLLGSIIAKLLIAVRSFRPIRVGLHGSMRRRRAGGLPFHLPRAFCSIHMGRECGGRCASVDQVSSKSGGVFFVLALIVTTRVGEVPLLLLRRLRGSMRPELLRGLLATVIRLTNSAGILVADRSPCLVGCLRPAGVGFNVPARLKITSFQDLGPGGMTGMLGGTSTRRISINRCVFRVLLSVSYGSRLVGRCFGW